MKHDIDLELTLFFQIGPVPWALVTADGSPVKSDKSKLLHNLKGTIVPSDQPAIQGSVYICDGNAILHAVTGIPETFEDVAEKIFGILPKAKCIDFVTDTYNPNSIKSFEGHYCGSSQHVSFLQFLPQLIAPEFPISQIRQAAETPPLLRNLVVSPAHHADLSRRTTDITQLIGNNSNTYNGIFRYFYVLFFQNKYMTSMSGMLFLLFVQRLFQFGTKERKWEGEQSS